MTYMDFPLDEYIGRNERIRTLMAEAGLDALVLSDQGNLVYAAGYRTLLYISKFRPFLAILPLEADPVLVLPNLEVGVGRRMSWIQDVRGWGVRGHFVDGPDALTIVRDVVAERRLGGKRIGFELNSGQRLGMTHHQFQAISEVFVRAGCEIGDCAEIMWKARSKKSEREIDCLRRAGRATDEGYLEALRVARVDVTEREISSAIAVGMVNGGGDWPGFIIVQSGPDRYDMTNPPASDRPLETGDMVILDIGAVYRGYWGDLTRAFFVGEPSRRQRELYGIVHEIFLATKAAVRPGITIEAVDRVADDMIRGAGYANHVLHRTGHAIGLDVHELPSVASGDTTVLEPGMVVTIEPGIYDFADGAFRIEDVVVVTETGHESLNTASPSEIIVI